jgi:hypothetical protein
MSEDHVSSFDTTQGLEIEQRPGPRPEKVLVTVRLTENGGELIFEEGFQLYPGEAISWDIDTDACKDGDVIEGRLTYDPSRIKFFDGKPHLHREQSNEPADQCPVLPG